MEERTETVTRRRRQDGVWGTLCRWANTSDWGWKEYSVGCEPQRDQYEQGQGRK
ncbi:Uncharacterised protein [Escherichia coli]|uniref:Uncharacterized protein n=1 Tax=Escherichia coli TaxID=562 RepID=A0A2X3K5D4_ECOLX|nr:Uncharacterised protein [Escherichia coli]